MNTQTSDKGQKRELRTTEEYGQAERSSFSCRGSIAFYPFRKVISARNYCVKRRFTSRGGGLSVSIWVCKDLRFGLGYTVRPCLKGKSKEAKLKPDLCPAYLLV